MKSLKKILALVSSLLVVSSMCMPVHADTYLTGDVNRDGKITTMDLILGKLFTLGSTTLSKDNLIAFDTNFDGKCNVLDLINIKEMILKITQPIENDGQIQKIEGNLTIDDNTFIKVDGVYNQGNIDESYINLDTQTTEKWSLTGNITSNDAEIQYSTPYDIFRYSKSNKSVSVSNINNTDYINSTYIPTENGDGFNANLISSKYPYINANIDFTVTNDEVSKLNTNVKNLTDGTEFNKTYITNPNDYVQDGSKVYSVRDTSISLNNGILVERGENSVSVIDNTFTFNNLTKVEFSFDNDKCSYIVQNGDTKTPSQNLEATENGFQLNDTIVYVTKLDDETVLIQFISQDDSIIQYVTASIEDGQIKSKRFYIADSTETFNLSQVAVTDSLCSVGDISISMKENETVQSLFDSYIQSTAKTEWLYTHDSLLTSESLVFNFQEDIPIMFSTIDNFNDNFSMYYIYSFGNDISNTVSLNVIDKHSKENIFGTQSLIKQYGSTIKNVQDTYSKPNSFVTTRFFTDSYTIYYTQYDVTAINNTFNYAMQLNDSDKVLIQTNDDKTYSLPLDIQSYIPKGEN